MKKIVLSLLMLAALTAVLYSYSVHVMSELDSSLIRLHITAGSDSDYDQNIKLAVRDKILDAVKDISARDTENFTAAAENAANTYLEEHSLPYRARAEYGKFTFPRKSYKNVTLPAGEYNGIRVILGSGSGHNWWCVMYPPLCVSGDGNVYADEKTTAMLKNSLRPDVYELITSGSEKAEIKFKIIELINKLRRSERR